MASGIALNKCIVCSTLVHASNNKVRCIMCKRSAHLHCICSGNSTFYCHFCLADALPFVHLSDDEYFDQIGFTSKHILTRTLSEYPRLNLNSYVAIDTKFINNEFIDPDTSHYSSVCNLSCEYADTPQLNIILPPHCLAICNPWFILTLVASQPI